MEVGDGWQLIITIFVILNVFSKNHSSSDLDCSGGSRYLPSLSYANIPIYLLFTASCSNFSLLSIASLTRFISRSIWSSSDLCGVSCCVQCMHKYHFLRIDRCVRLLCPIAAFLLSWHFPLSIVDGRPFIRSSLSVLGSLYHIIVVHCYQIVIFLVSIVRQISILLWPEMPIFSLCNNVQQMLQWSFKHACRN